ncbi:hypothetical protein Cgig2_024414 [Carnegiea gigantea]|uniref:Squalene cyclase C-terminal domain-containing protein n=1 Tax=Carnegiea gigantea TaxID=171969 RepID=A0A9Q1KKT8_9CARY|nr:hypothetical protein Cgig2_024414 [Carnegiea gigantea]
MTCISWQEDLYYPYPMVQDMLWGFLHHFAEPLLNRWPLSKLRDKAMKIAMQHVHYEDQNSRYLCIGCVEKVEDPNSDAFKRHLARIPYCLWIAEDGMKMQLRENPSGNFKEMYRHISKGAWTFSIQDHGWQVSDCTAEGHKIAVLLSQRSPDLVGEAMDVERLNDAVNIILSLQKFNPTELFEDVLIEREYVECTSSAIHALVLFKKFYPTHRRKEIETLIYKAVQYIENSQNPDGSWYGCWGICFTYGTWFAVDALAACGRNYQNSVHTNMEGNKSNLVNTSWALLALIKAGQADVDPIPIERGVRLLVNSQMEDRDFPQQANLHKKEITGIFMKTRTLNWSAFQNIFPIWNLGEYCHLQARRCATNF